MAEQPELPKGDRNVWRAEGMMRGKRDVWIGLSDESDFLNFRISSNFGISDFLRFTAL